MLLVTAQAHLRAEQDKNKLDAFGIPIKLSPHSQVSRQHLLRKIMFTCLLIDYVDC